MCRLAKVYSFEPLGYLQVKFKKNIALNNCENVTLFPLALSDADGELTVSIDEHNWNQGTFNLQHNDRGSVSQKIAVKAGDNMTEIQNLDRLDLIKIDVEGFEFQVLRGLKETLKKHKPRIIFEYDHHHWRDTAQSITDCFSFLTDLDYKVFQILVVGAELITSSGGIETGNLFCIPGDVKE
jgi:FkbM family methyltransferase